MLHQDIKPGGFYRCFSNSIADINHSMHRVNIQLLIFKSWQSDFTGPSRRVESAPDHGQE